MYIYDRLGEWGVFRGFAVNEMILYHDAILDPLSNNNEEMSAELFLSENPDIPQNTKDRVVEGILATKHHPSATTDDLELLYFLDADMSVMADSLDVYKRYAVNIAREYLYAGVDYDTYRYGRVQFLKNARSSNPFHMPPMMARYAVLMRNVDWEIRNLPHVMQDALTNRFNSYYL